MLQGLEHVNAQTKTPFNADDDAGDDIDVDADDGIPSPWFHLVSQGAGKERGTKRNARHSRRPLRVISVVSKMCLGG